jgi:hypothetical protein
MVFGVFGGKSVEISIGLDRADGTYAIGDTVGAQIVLANASGGKVREVRAGPQRVNRLDMGSRSGSSLRGGQASSPRA